MDSFLIYVSRSSLLYCLVCSLQHCDHLLGKGRPFGSLCVMSTCVLYTVRTDICDAPPLLAPFLLLILLKSDHSDCAVMIGFVRYLAGSY